MNHSFWAVGGLHGIPVQMAFELGVSYYDGVNYDRKLNKEAVDSNFSINQNGNIEFAVTFLYSFFTVQNELKVLNRVDLNLADKSFKNVVVYYKEKDKRHKSKDDFKPQKIYWDIQYGIIKYETYKGEVWERIN